MYRCASHYSPYLSRPCKHQLPLNGSVPSGTPCSVNTGYPWRFLTRLFGASQDASQEQSLKSTETALETMDSARLMGHGDRSLLARVNALLIRLQNR